MSMKTERLFYENVYLREFTARVLFCGEEERGCYVILDRTAFYPEGGGQPADTGVLLIPSAEAEAGSGNVAGERTAAENRMVGEKNPKISVRDVQYVGDEIRHYVDVLPEVGSQVRGCIDWDRRFDLMQQHSGEHLVSGCIHSRYGYDNVGFHMGEDVITVDVNGLLDEKQLLEIEKQVNRYIWSNRPVRVFFSRRGREKPTAVPEQKRTDRGGAPGRISGWRSLCLLRTPCGGSRRDRAGQTALCQTFPTGSPHGDGGRRTGDADSASA